MEMKPEIAWQLFSRKMKSISKMLRMFPNTQCQCLGDLLESKMTCGQCLFAEAYEIL